MGKPSGGTSAHHFSCGPSVCDCQGLNMERNKAFGSPGGRPGAIPAFCFSHWVSRQSKQKSLTTLPLPLGYFLLHAFHFSALWCNPSGVSDWRYSSSLIFFFFFFFFRFSNEAHPLNAVTRLYSASDGSVGVGAHQSFSLAHTHSPLLPTSSILTPPSIQDTAEWWCCWPEPDALSCSHMRHLSGPAPPSCCSLSSTCTSVARVMGSGPLSRAGGSRGVMFGASPPLYRYILKIYQLKTLDIIPFFFYPIITVFEVNTNIDVWYVGQHFCCCCTYKKHIIFDKDTLNLFL